MEWWQKKVKGWTVPFWYSDTPLYSKRAVDYGLDKLAEQIRKDIKKTQMSLLYKKQEDIITSVEVRHISGGRVVLDFSADCGKFGTDEMLDGYTLTADRLLMILQHSEIITEEENYS